MRKTPFLALVSASALLAACGSSSASKTADTSATDQKVEVEARAHCTSGTPVTGRPLQIAATVAPITSLVGGVVGEAGAQVRGIIPEGTNSHTFEPPPSAAADLEKADVIFINGLVLEEPTKDLAKANLHKGAVICELGTSILPESEWIYDFSFPKSGGKPNPHLWTNPPMAHEYADVIRETLVHMDPTNKATYDSNYAALTSQVDAVDAAMKTATATIPEAQRELLTYHDAYAYFSKHYGYKIVGAIQPQSFEEPTPKDIANLITQIKSEKVPAIFGSEVFPSPVLQQIGKETGVRYVDVLRDDDLVGKPGDADHSWAGLMRFDYVTMVDALGGDSAALKNLNLSLPQADKAYYPQ
jgi:ABC-type Zn uptake system ZnuABC Zn-binding protein ZnuA